MKKLIFVFATVFIGLISCKQSGKFLEDQGDYGTVVFDLTGNSNLRSVDPATGLPNLVDSEMKILVEAGGQRAQTITFSQHDKKQYRKTFLVGTKIKFTAVVITKSGKWKGSSEITVTTGTNNLSVKLKKAIAELEPLKFKLYEQKSTQQTIERKFSLGFFDEGVTFFHEEVSESMYKDVVPSFCRDSKGRIYVFYRGKDGPSQKIFLKRYTIEGDLDSSFSYEESANDKALMFVVADIKTGNVFVSYKTGIPAKTKLFLVHQEGGTVTLKDVTPSDISDVSAISVYSDIISTVGLQGNNNAIELYKYNDENTPVSKIGEKLIERELLDIQVQGSGHKFAVSGAFVDSFMNDKNIYLLYRNTDGQNYFVSTGRILKCGYTVQDATGNIVDVKKLIAKDEYEADDHDIINVKDEYEKKEFYCPQRFVGFSEDVLYVADDGTVREYEAGVAQVVKNKNRLVSFNLSKESISIEREDVETWMPEKEVIAKANPTLFFSYGRENNEPVAKLKLHDGNKFFNIKKNGVNIGQTLTLSNPDDSLIYAFDSRGALYVLYMKKVASHKLDKLEKYSPHVLREGEIVYEYDSDFAGDNLKDVDGHHISGLYYDSVKKDLYYKISGSLYRYDDRIHDKWDKIDAHNQTSQVLTIYDGKSYEYDKDTKNIEVRKVENTDELEKKIPIPPSAISTNDIIVGFSIYKDVFYLLFQPVGKDDVFVLAMNKEGGNVIKMEHPLFKSLHDLQDIKPIGFDDKTSELKFFYEAIEKDYDGRVMANINKYVLLKHDGNTLSKTEMDTPSDDIKWYTEANVWKGTKDVLLWKTHTNNEAAYFAVSEKDIESSSNPNLEGNGVYFIYDKFCYDQFGNLYVLMKKDNDYYVVRFKLNEEGRYELQELDNRIAKDFDNWHAKFKIPSPSIDVDKFIMTVYADKPDSGWLYFRMFDNPSSIDIKKCRFIHGNLNGASDDAWLSGVNIYDMSKNLEKQFVAIAANKDGVFIAQRELQYVGVDYEKGNHKSYNIEVRKYPFDNPVYDSPTKTVNIVGAPSNKLPTDMFRDYGILLDSGNANWDGYINETVTDMYAYDGVLYAISYKRVGGMIFYTNGEDHGDKFKKAEVSGAIWKVGDTAEFANSNATSLCSSENVATTPEKSFVPYRIIGVLPKKLVIASDYYNAYTDSDGKRWTTNHDQVYFFDTNKGDVIIKETKQVKEEATFKFNLGGGDNGSQTTSAFSWN